MSERSGVELRCEGVVHLYPMPGGDVVALRGVDLMVTAGEVLALLGPSGAGKSTLLALLAGLLRPSSGEIRIGTHLLNRMRDRELERMRATEISLVPQDTDRSLLPYATVEQNVRFAQRGAVARGAAPPWSPVELLDLLGLAGAAHRPAGSMSGGEQQQVALAVGIAPAPRLLLVDEPTSQLDPIARDTAVELLLRISRVSGATVVVVTHDEHVAGAVSRTVTIRDGRVGAEGLRGEELAVVGRDGSLQLPDDMLDLLPPGTLVRLHREADELRLRAVAREPGE